MEEKELYEIFLQIHEAKDKEVSWSLFKMFVRTTELALDVAILDNSLSK